MVQEPANIIRLDEARQVLAKAKTLCDVKRIRDKAEAVREYAKRQGWGLEMQNNAAEMKLRAERKAGELLAGMELKPGRRRNGDTMSPNLADIGIEKKQSERWQRVAGLDEDTFEQHIETTKADKEELTTASVLTLAKIKANGKRNDAVTQSSSTDCIKSIVTTGEKFGTIYADPPWKYGNQATRASTDNHYPTMTVEEIALLPVKELAAEKCHLWLWTTNGFIFECPKLFEAWGFEFKSSYVWCKTQMGIGNYLRNAHEFLLLATKGGLVGAARDVRSWGEFPRGKHSSKPEKIREDVIERVSPGPRLELFGRATVPGWTVWGNQVRKDLFNDARV